ncbi:MAG: penicillin-insensitive murein endopeptidase [Pseudomonadota bacterium]
MRFGCVAAVVFCLLPHHAGAQQNSAEEAARRTEALRVLPQDAAKRLFFLKQVPAQISAQSIGNYGKGCVAGAEQLPPDGDGWQAMRLSRHRNYGHPRLVAVIKKIAALAKKEGWPGLLVGDMGQPRGGPMLTGHASHQLGLEADIWLTPAPADHVLSMEEREEMSAVDMVQPDLLNVWPDKFGAGQVMLLHHAAEQPDVERIFVNPAIKKAACEMVRGDRTWLRKLRPWHGHTFHFHIALKCPDAACKARPAIPPGDGCGKAMDWWFLQSTRFPKPKPPQPEKILTMKDMPQACAAILNAP